MLSLVPQNLCITQSHEVHLISVELPYDVTQLGTLFLPVHSNNYLGDALWSCYGWYSRSFHAIRVLSAFSKNHHSLGFSMKVVFVRNPSFSWVPNEGSLRQESCM